jgi:hypothetical protein
LSQVLSDAMYRIRHVDDDLDGLRTRARLVQSSCECLQVSDHVNRQRVKIRML